MSLRISATTVRSARRFAESGSAAGVQPRMLACANAAAALILQLIASVGHGQPSYSTRSASESPGTTVRAMQQLRLR